MLSRAGANPSAGCSAPADATAPIDEGIEHQIEELVGKLECDLLRPCRGFAGKLVQGCGEIVAGEAEERHEGRRQRASIVEEVVDRMADVELVNGEGAAAAGQAAAGKAAARVVAVWVLWSAVSAALAFGNELRPEVEQCGIAGIAQARSESRPASPR